jgi:hypothetical protein
VYHEKQEVGSTVWITYSFVGESLLDKYKQGVDHLSPLLSQSHNAKVLLGTILAWGNQNQAFVRYPWSDYSVHLGFREGSGGTDSDDLFEAILVPVARDQRRTIESERL